MDSRLGDPDDSGRNTSRGAGLENGGRLLVPLPPSTVETYFRVTQGTTAWIQAEGSVHVCMVQIRATNYVTIKGQMHQKYARNSIGGRGCERVRGPCTAKAWRPSINVTEIHRIDQFQEEF